MADANRFPESWQSTSDGPSKPDAYDHLLESLGLTEETYADFLREQVGLSEEEIFRHNLQARENETE